MFKIHNRILKFFLSLLDVSRNFPHSLESVDTCRLYSWNENLCQAHQDLIKRYVQAGTWKCLIKASLCFVVLHGCILWEYKRLDRFDKKPSIISFADACLVTCLHFHVIPRLYKRYWHLNPLIISLKRQSFFNWELPQLNLTLALTVCIPFSFSMRLAFFDSQPVN